MNASAPAPSAYHFPASHGQPQQPGFLAGAGSVLPLVVLAYSFLLTAPEVRFTLVGVSLTPYRFVLIPLFLRILLAMVSGRIRFGIADILVLISSIATLASFMHHNGAGIGAVRAFGTLIDSAGSYFVARSCIRTPRDLRVFMLLIAPGIALAGGLMALESVSRNLIVRPFFARYFGSATVYQSGEAAGNIILRRDIRLAGLMRAYGNFSHPIMGGMILGSTILLYFYSGIRGLPRLIGMVSGFLGAFSLSSAAFIMIGLSIAIAALNEVVQRMRALSWWIIATLTAIVGMLIEFGSGSGLVNVLIRQTLDPQTGYFRKLIWQYGLISVRKNLWFGIGDAEYERPSFMHTGSVDAHFLALAIRDGIFAALPMFAALAVTLITLGMALRRVTGLDRKLMLGLNTVLFGLLVGSMTVTYFHEALVWYMALLGIGVTLAQYSSRAWLANSV